MRAGGSRNHQQQAAQADADRLRERGRGQDQLRLHEQRQPERDADSERPCRVRSPREEDSVCQRRPCPPDRMGDSRRKTCDEPSESASACHDWRRCLQDRRASRCRALRAAEASRPDETQQRELLAVDRDRHADHDGSSRDSRSPSSWSRTRLRRSPSSARSGSTRRSNATWRP